MDEVVIAVIGAIGVVVPVLLSTRFGKWRRLHLIQEEGRAYEAIPPELIEERARIAKSIAEHASEYNKGPTAFSILLGSTLLLWIFSFGALAGSSILDGSNPFEDEQWDKTVQTIGTVLVIVSYFGIVLAFLTIVLVVVLETFTWLIERKSVQAWAIKHFRPWYWKRVEKKEAKRLRNLPEQAESRPDSTSRSET